MPAGAVPIIAFVERFSPPLAWLPLGWNRWLAIWFVLAAGSACVALVLRTRLRKASAWRKCALLSLWVHVVLVVLATAVQIVSGVPGEGPDEPIRVALLPAELPAEVVPAKAETLPKWERPQDPARLEPPPLALPDPAPAEKTPVEPVDEQYAEPLPAEAPSPPPVPTPTPPEPLSAPPLLPSPQPEPAPVQPPSDKQAEQSVDTAVEPTPTEPTAAQSPAPNPSASTPQQPAPRPTPPVTPPTYAARFSPDRAEIVARRGGNAQTEQAVRSALAWLAAAQDSDGRWNAARFGAGGERRTLLGHDRAGAGSRADSAVTGLALLAFLGSGHTHQGGEYARHVARGLDWLAALQAHDGSLAGEATTFDRTYCHSMATLAVCEAYAITRDPRLRQVAAAAAGHSVATQNPQDGSWRYWPGMPGDTSQLGWQLMALKSADLAGLDVPAVVWTRADRFMRSVTRGASGGLASYRPDSRPTTSMTAEGLFCRQLLVDRLGGAVDDGCYGEAAATLLGEIPGSGEANLYCWYYATLALCREQDRSPVAKAAWQRWNDGLVRTLLAQQRTDGSWPASTLWGGCGGQVYTTAIAALSLEAYYRYLPMEPETELARRREWRSGPQ
ncbi:MAG: hypothetical protein KF847_19015 [Pirellulales bacterium]|nr:hypothetical protein [Pirellulales bacterium]